MFQVRNCDYFGLLGIYTYDVVQFLKCLYVMHYSERIKGNLDFTSKKIVSNF